MSIKELRDVLYCHLMDLESEHPYNWDYDIWQVKQALREAVEYLEREMEYIRRPIAK